MKALTTPLVRLALFSCALCLGFVAHAEDNGRGLITLEGPSGLFINPTSGVMPEGNGTLQYCIFLPNNETDTIGHGLMSSYGVTEDLEVGLYGNYIDRDVGDNLFGAGPLARYRVLKEDNEMPELSLGGYSQFLGDEERERYSVFGAAYKNLPIADDGAIRSVGLHLGLRHSWVGSDAPGDDEFAVYGGLQVELPAYLYLVGEVSNEHDNANDVPYAVGLQWRAAGIAMSLAAIQNGGLDDPSFYYGIGYAGKF